jgi:chromosome segregation ATPase
MADELDNLRTAIEGFEMLKNERDSLRDQNDKIKERKAALEALNSMLEQELEGLKHQHDHALMMIAGLEEQITTIQSMANDAADEIAETAQKQIAKIGTYANRSIREIRDDIFKKQGNVAIADNLRRIEEAVTDIKPIPEFLQRGPTVN